MGFYRAESKCAGKNTFKKDLKQRIRICLYIFLKLKIKQPQTIIPLPKIERHKVAKANGLTLIATDLPGSAPGFLTQALQF